MYPSKQEIELTSALNSSQMQELISKLPSLAEKNKSKNKEFFSRLKKKPPAKLDETVQQIHDDIFSRMDCLACANCCKTLGPRISDKDIARISGHLKIKPSDFTGKYLSIDEDNDYVFKSMPCPFLGADNYCSIYEQRPTACRNYPHTDRKKFIQLLDITLNNVSICPAVYEISGQLRKKL